MTVRKPECCEFMKQQINRICPQCGPDCPDNALKWGFYLTLEDGSLAYGDEPATHRRWNIRLIAPNAAYECSFCPSCGAAVPQDQMEPLPASE